MDTLAFISCLLGPLILASLALQLHVWKSRMRAWRRADATGPAAAAARPPAYARAPARVWVLVAARDEEARLPGLARALAAQRGGVDIRPVLVDDGSRDGTAAAARRALAPWPAARVLEGPARGKPAALAAGLEFVLGEAAEEDPVLFTDADCRPAPDWAAAHAAARAAGAVLACGHLRLVDGEGRPRPALRRFESAVSSLQVALGCAAGRPPYARGGNWSAQAGLLRRVEAVRALRGLASGDDVHLVRRLAAADSRCVFLTPPLAMVVAREPAGPTADRRQARRRYGKIRELPAAEVLRQAGLFLALAAQPVLLAGLAQLGWANALAHLALLAILAMETRRLLAEGLARLGEAEAAERAGRLGLRLLARAAWHSLAGAWGGYRWRPAPTLPGDPAAGGAA